PCFFPVLCRRHARSTLFPYTTLFRSCAVKAPAPEPAAQAAAKPVHPACQPAAAGDQLAGNWLSKHRQKGVVGELRTLFTLQTDRSEEHTSELQSRENLVCRLLLEKKK